MIISQGHLAGHTYSMLRMMLAYLYLTFFVGACSWLQVQTKKGCAAQDCNARYLAQHQLEEIIADAMREAALELDSVALNPKKMCLFR